MAGPTSVSQIVSPIPGSGTPPAAAAWQSAFEAALPYEGFLDRHATADQRARWDAFHARVRLSADQERLLAGFVRKMPVLILAGAWCGD